MIRILLIRHGNTDPLGRVLYGRMPGVHLNAEGRRQAEAMAQTLKQRYTLSEVVSSPMERTRETAQFVADAQGLNITTEEEINEIDFGLWMGKSFEELTDREDWKRYNESRSTAWPPGGECMMEVQARGSRAMAKIVARYQHQEDVTVAAVSHGDVVRALLLLVLGMPIDHIHRLEVAPGSLSEVLLGSGEPRVVHVNQIF
jgi:broad specificity phosphatase PhoE